MKRLLVINLSEELYDLEFEGANSLLKSMVTAFLEEPETRKLFKAFPFISECACDLGPIAHALRALGLTHVSMIQWQRPNLIVELTDHEPSK